MTLERLSSSNSPAKVTGQDLREQDLIMVVAALVRELHPQRFKFIDVRPSSRIERDLGIDSLGRTELILRIERAFRVRLPAQTIGEAETVHDLVQALEQARPTQGRMALEPRQAPLFRLCQPRAKHRPWSRFWNGMQPTIPTVCI